MTKIKTEEQIKKEKERYKEGKIYSIKCKITNKIYIGSTITSIERRMLNHKGDMGKERTKNILLYKHMKEFGFENFEIKKIEDWPCDNLRQLEKREAYWQIINNTVNNGLNMQYACEIPVYEKELEKIIELKKKKKLFLVKEVKNRSRYNGRNIEQKEQTRKKYQKSEKAIELRRKQDKKRSGREDRLEWRRENYKLHAEKISKKNKEKIKCECGVELRKVDFKRHEKSKKHLQYLENQK